jgi:hypothetical protein
MPVLISWSAARSPTTGTSRRTRHTGRPARTSVRRWASWLSGRRFTPSADPAADAEPIQTEVYEIGKRHGAADLRAWFKALYEILLDRARPALRLVRRVLRAGRDHHADPWVLRGERRTSRPPEPATLPAWRARLTALDVLDRVLGEARPLDDSFAGTRRSPVSVARPGVARLGHHRAAGSARSTPCWDQPCRARRGDPGATCLARRRPVPVPEHRHTPPWPDRRPADGPHARWGPSTPLRRVAPEGKMSRAPGRRPAEHARLAVAELDDGARRGGRARDRRSPPRRAAARSVHQVRSRRLGSAPWWRAAVRQHGAAADGWGDRGPAGICRGCLVGPGRRRGCRRACREVRGRT